MRQCPRATPSGFSIGTSANTKYLLSRKARISFLSSKNFSRPRRQKLEGVSMGCTLAEMKTTGLLLRKRAIFCSLKGWSLTGSKPSLPSWEVTRSRSMTLPS